MNDTPMMYDEDGKLILRADPGYQLLRVTLWESDELDDTGDISVTRDVIIAWELIKKGGGPPDIYPITLRRSLADQYLDDLKSARTLHKKIILPYTLKLQKASEEEIKAAEADADRITKSRSTGFIEFYFVRCPDGTISNFGVVDDIEEDQFISEEQLMKNMRELWLQRFLAEGKAEREDDEADDEADDG